VSTADFAFPKPQRPAAKERRPWKRNPKPELSPADAEWVGFVHQEPCVGIADFAGHKCWSPDDENPIDASHVGRRGGVALKGPWTHTIPKCRRLHMQLHALSGPFKGWTREQLRSWGMAHVRRLDAKFRARDLGAPSQAEAPAPPDGSPA
jgi:hypothetical protein